MKQAPKNSALELDGAHGEGGGSVVRAGITMSALTGVPVHIKNVRGALNKPGANAVDLGLISILGKATNAKSEAAIGNREIVFTPTKQIAPVRDRVDLNSLAKSTNPGSATLVAQSLLAPLCRAGGISNINCRGGTHVPFSPSFDYFRLVTIPAFAQIGIGALPTLDTASYSTRGSGELSVEIEPSALNGFDFSSRGKPLPFRCVIALSELPESVGLRGIKKMNSLAEKQGVSIKTDFVKYRSGSPGACASFAGVFETGFGGSQFIGERGLPIEDVVEKAFADFIHWLNSEKGVDEFLSDQLLIPAILSRDDCAYTTSRITPTLLTTAWVIKQFMPAKVTILGEEGSPGEVKISK